MRLATLALFSLTLASRAQPPHEPEDVLAHARDKFLDRADRLPNYTCVQTVNRRYYKREIPEYPIPSCDQMSREKAAKAYNLTLAATDRLRLEVKISNGEEISAWAGSSHFDEQTVGELAGGPFSTGALGSFLMDIFDVSNTRFDFDGEDVMAGIKLFRYRYQVPRDSSHYMVKAGRDWRVTAYDGAIWVDPHSFELIRLSVRTAELPAETGACETSTMVEYAATPIGAGSFLLPRQSDLHFLLRNTTENEISIAYSSCRQFVGEAKLVTDPGAIDQKPADAPIAPIPIPPGLELPLKLEQSIDTDTAAAGDVVLAKVSKPVGPVKSRDVVIPAGSVVRGRIVRMEHWLNSPSRFVIAIELDTVEINGVPSPLYATMAQGQPRGRQIFLPPPGQSRPASIIAHESKAKHDVIPRGYAMNWVTISAPDSAAKP